MCLLDPSVFYCASKGCNIIGIHVRVSESEVSRSFLPRVVCPATANAITKRNLSALAWSHKHHQHHPSLRHFFHLPGVTSEQHSMADLETAEPAPALSFDKSEILTLLVGPKRWELVVHEKCLTRNSDFFKAAVKKEWTEGQTRTIKLPEELCFDTFVRYLNFTYREKLHTEEAKTVSGKHFESLAKIYVLGERMLDRPVQHAVVREMIRLTTIRNKEGRTKFSAALVLNIAYEGTSTGSPLRRLLVDMHVLEALPSWSYCKHPEFLRDFSQALLEKVIAQKTIRDFRNRVLIAEDYFS
jgi:hypothetical protein